MRWLLLLLCLGGMLQPQNLYGHSRQVELHRARLACGGTHFYAKTEFVGLIPILQAMTTTLKNSKPAKKIDLRQTTIPYPSESGAIMGLASIVDGWQCRKTPAGHVLVLWYECPQYLRENIPDAFCSSTGEWERWVSLDGSLLNKGFSFEDKRYDRLQEKLGYHVDPSQAVDQGPFISIH